MHILINTKDNKMEIKDYLIIQFVVQVCIHVAVGLFYFLEKLGIH